jgi:uncharacterized protein (TIGR00369 family)
MPAEPHRVSAFLQLIGAQIDDWQEGRVRYSLMIEEKHTNPNGVLHGGVLTSLMDEATGAAIVSVRGVEIMETAPHATVEMNVSFMAGVRPGDRIIIDAKTLRVGRSVAFAEAEVRREGRDDLVAKGRFTYVITAKAK